MPVGSLHHHLRAVDVDAVAGADLDRPEAEVLAHGVANAAARLQLHRQPIAVGGLRAPGPHARERSLQVDLGLAGRRGRRHRRAHRQQVLVEDAGGDLRALGRIAPEHVHGQRAVRPRVDREAIDRLRRRGLQRDGPEDAAERPVVRLPLRLVHGGVRGFLGDGHLELVRRADRDEIGDVVFEAIEGALVSRPRAAAVHGDGGVRHRSLEHDRDPLPCPGRRHVERPPVDALLGRARSRYRSGRCRSRGTPSCWARGSSPPGPPAAPR